MICGIEIQDVKLEILKMKTKTKVKMNMRKQQQ